MPAHTTQIRTHALAYSCLAALFLLSVTTVARNVYDSIDTERHTSEYARPPFYLGDANWGAVGLQPEAAAAGMKYADAVLAVNGRPVNGFFVYYGALRQARTGDRLHLRVQYPGDTRARDLSIELRPYRSRGGAVGLSSDVGFALRVVALPVACMALGFWVAAVRVRNRSAWLLLVLLLSFPSYIGVPGEAAIVRKIRKVNGREPREKDHKDRAGCTDPNPLSSEPLAFLLAAHRSEYRFKTAAIAKDLHPRRDWRDGPPASIQSCC